MRNNEQGRSMIEMLGVLAIVGVLSVGGIAGYSKAMGKFKTNKLIDQINMVTTNIRTLYATQPSYSGLNEAMAKQANLIPAEMYTTATGSTITNAFGGRMTLAPSDLAEDGDNKAYVIAVDNVPSTACVAIATTDWGSDSDSGLIGMSIDRRPTGTLSELDDFGIEEAASNDSESEELTPEQAALATGATVHTPQAGNIPYNIADTTLSCGNNTFVTIGWKYM